MTDRVYNFSAGPAVLPVPVLEEAQKNLLSLPGVGMSVLESSHRSPHFTEIIETAEANLRNLLNVPDNYSLLFLQGGASLQFSMIAINFLSGTEKPADYILTGSWGKKAIKEAKREGTVNVAWDGADGNYN
ncbi:MAG: aminotransferase class V-fold PLP-dependent enzyme, partial [Candidatus Omnitrophica bacterium]|nr:aminotransferase class V-fold PLP-dependent enzyme [Candidatus Omnitrophota bacterium]